MNVHFIHSVIFYASARVGGFADHLGAAPAPLVAEWSELNWLENCKRERAHTHTHTDILQLSVSNVLFLVSGQTAGRQLATGCRPFAYFGDVRFAIIRFGHVNHVARNNTRN